MGRFRASWEVAGSSAQVLRRHPRLLAFLSLWLLLGAGVLAGAARIAQGDGTLPDLMSGDPRIGAGAVLLGLLAYLALAFLGTLLAAALVASVSQALAGGRPSVAAGLAAALRRVVSLGAWGLLAATLGVGLDVLRERGGTVDRVAPSLESMPWRGATHLVVPVVVLGEDGLRASIKRSGHLFRATWGEANVGLAGPSRALLPAGGVAAAAACLGLAVFPHDAVAGTSLLAAAAAVAFLVAGVHATLQAVHKAALHRYATAGAVPAGFAPQQVQGAFLAARPTRRWLGRAPRTP